MDRYAHPSAIPRTPLRHSAPPQSGVALSSSSSNFDPHTDEGELYSPAEVRSIDAVRFDAAEAPSRLRPATLAANAARVFRRGRQADVHIMSDPPSVPQSPLGTQQESVRQFSATAPLPDGAAAPGSPAHSAAQLIQRYVSQYHGGVEASLHNVLAIMNPASGETGVSQTVLAGLRDELGTKRVLQLTGDVFADPAPLRRLIKEQAVLFHLPGRPARHQRGTVVVCGGDGTVSFIMTQLDLVRRELEAEFRPFLTEEQQGQQAGHQRVHSLSQPGLPDMIDESAHPYFTIPALAPLPLGTGNDYSNCVGFGKGFTPSGRSCFSGLCALLGCEDGAESQVAAALAAAVAAPCVTFDRWEVSLVPLQLAQKFLKVERGRVTREAASPSTPSPSSFLCRAASPPPRESTQEGDTATPHLPAEKGEGGDVHQSSSINSSVAASASAVVGERSDVWRSRVVSAANTASNVHLVDWAGIYATQEVSTYGLINYLSIGYDAYVAGKFDETRRAYPAVCSTRTQNKAVYVSLGIGGAMRCKRLRKLVPMICVPRPVLPGTANTAPAAALSIHASPTAVSQSSGNATAAAAEKKDYVALQLPNMTKSLVISNVSCYGAGTHPWNPQGGALYYRPVALRNGELVASPIVAGANTEEIPLPAPRPRPVSINDRNFEVQTMGGILHYSTLGFGLSSSTKLLQTGEMFAFVLCTPEDLCFPSGQCSAYTRRNLKDKYESRIETDAGVRASLSVQIDGEAMPGVTEPTVVHVRRQQGPRILVRCRNPEVVQ